MFLRSLTALPRWAAWLLELSEWVLGHKQRDPAPVVDEVNALSLVHELARKIKACPAHRSCNKLGNLLFARG